MKLIFVAIIFILISDSFGKKSFIYETTEDYNLIGNVDSIFENKTHYNFNDKINAYDSIKYENNSKRYKFDKKGRVKFKNNNYDTVENSQVNYFYNSNNMLMKYEIRNINKINKKNNMVDNKALVTGYTIQDGRYVSGYRRDFNNNLVDTITFEYKTDS